MAKRCCLCGREFRGGLVCHLQEVRPSGEELQPQKWCWCHVCYEQVKLESCGRQVSPWDYLTGFLHLVRRMDDITERGAVVGGKDPAGHGRGGGDVHPDRPASRHVEGVSDDSIIQSAAVCGLRGDYIPGGEVRELRVEERVEPGADTEQGDERCCAKTADTKK